jgi:prepilin-type N-terminal cleavage/methylation domain-containing protein
VKREKDELGPVMNKREKCAPPAWPVVARRSGQAGLTLAELLIVVSIISVVVGLSLPSLSRAIDNARLKAATQQLVSLYQDARFRATQNDTSYEVLVSAAGVQPAQACVDLNADGRCEAAEPATMFSGPVALNNSGIPLLIGRSILGFDPQNTNNSHMVDGNNNPAPGLAWNSRGVPCERTDAITSPCSGIDGWVQYLQLPRGNGEVLYAAVTVSPTGRVKAWTYIPSGNGNGSWL